MSFLHCPLTGVLLTYEMQIKAAFDPSVAPSAGQTQPLSADEILQIAKPAFPGKTATLNFYSDEGKPVSVSAGRHESKLINPYDGSFIESGSNPTEGFFGLMESIHRNLAMGFDSMGGRHRQDQQCGFPVHHPFRRLSLATAQMEMAIPEAEDFLSENANSKGA